MNIRVSANYSKRFRFEPDIIIPANEKSIALQITTIDDAIPALSITPVFTASANGYKNGTISLILSDNDVPVINLSVTPGSVSESAGYQAAIGIVRRLGTTDNDITIKLTDNSNGMLYYSTPTIILEKGVAQKQFTIGVVDNVMVDGEKEFEITASVYISSCGCTTDGSGAGIVRSKLSVLDDDGPTLTVSTTQTMLAEGKDQAALLTVKRNTDTTLPLNISLSTDRPGEVVFESTFTIPTGNSSVSIPISAKNNSSSEGDRTVTFTAESEGYTKGVCWAMITDQTLPDATVRISSVSADNAYTLDTITANIVVENPGLAPLSAGAVVAVYLCNSTNLSTSTVRRLVANISLSKRIEVNSYETLSTTFSTPEFTGQYYLIAEINNNQLIKELSLLNNTSVAQSVVIHPAYRVDVSTDKGIYNQGETIRFSGKASALGNATTNGVNVEIYFINNGYRQTLTVKTDASGNFGGEFTPYTGQMGHFVAGACYPGEGISEVQSSFDIYGLKSITGNNVVWEVLENEQTIGEIELSNPGSIKLTGLKASIISNPAAGFTLIFDDINDLEGSKTAKLRYTLKGTIASTGKQYDQIKIQISSNEGAKLDITGHYYCRSPRAILKANISSLQTTMAKGETRSYPIQISNTGKGESGRISVNIPAVPWLSLTTPIEIPSLKFGESATIVLQLTPTDDMAANTYINGSIGVNCENGEGFPLDFSIETVSEKTGKLIVDVCNEYTYYTSEAPHLSGAKVTLKHPYTGYIVEEGTTDANGLFTIDNLSEGYYTIVVTADKHDSYTNNILVDPGKTTKSTINLSFQAITYTWNVVETEVEDEYDIVTEVKYETNVPVPIVEMNAPSKIETDNLLPGESLIFNAILTNKGLITANDVILIMPEGFKSLTFEPLIADGFSLKPQESRIIPIKVTRISANDNSQNTIKRSPASMSQNNIDDDPCIAYPGTLYFWDCGLDRKWHRYDIALQLGSCRNGNVPKDLEPGHQMTEEEFMNYLEQRAELTYLIAKLPTFTFHNASFSSTTPSNIVDLGCEPCQNGILLAGAKCAWHFVPLIEEIDAAADILKEFLMEIPDDGDFDLDLQEKELLNKKLLDKIDWGKKILDFANNTSHCFESIRNDSLVIAEKISSCYTNFEDQIEEILENNLDNIIPDKHLRKKVKRIGKKVTKFMKKVIPVLDCIGDFAHACDHLESKNVLSDSVFGTSNIPSYIQDFKIKAKVAQKEINSLQEIFNEITGEECWIECSIDELSMIFSQLHDNKQYNEIINFKPDFISETSLRKLVERWSNTMTKNYSNGNYINIDKLVLHHEIIREAENKAKEWGFNSMGDCIEHEIISIQEKAASASNSICSSISLQLSQTMTMTRQAFRGTLTVFNGHESMSMQDLKLDLTIQDSDGNVVGSQIFQVNTEKLDKLTAINGDGILDAQQTGTATILFIPSKQAAPTLSKKYTFGGTLSYLDPFTNTIVTRDLFPVTLTVNPSPDLKLDYFMQRTILGDDPLTTEVIEASEPAEFALLINNVGSGDANNVRFSTAQPQVVQNDKGLLNEIKLIGSSMNGSERTINFSDNNFGSIPAGKTTYAQWWFTSSLLGHFVDYNTKMTHVTSYDNPNLSLVSNVSIHELIRTLKITNAINTPVAGFLVNDIADTEDLPDNLYLTDGSKAEVTVNKNVAFTKVNNTSYTLTVLSAKKGWNYGVFDDPSNGQLVLTSIIRQSDQTVIELQNFWQTSRTLRDGKEPLYENKIHYADYIHNTSETYLLTFKNKRTDILKVQAFSGIPQEVALNAIKNINVLFNKAIDASTFTSDDIKLMVQGKNLDVRKIIIRPVTDTEFTIDISQVPEAKDNGFFVLAVHTNNINDYDGFSGEAGKQVNWKQIIDGKVQLTIDVQPVGSGTVTPETKEFNYGEKIQFAATPSNGYRFKNWTINKDIISTENVLSYPVSDQKNITANFEAKFYEIKILFNSAYGNVTGFFTGSYEFGKNLTIKAIPNTGYYFAGWKVNNIDDEISTSLGFNVVGDATIEAVFLEKQKPEISWNKPADIVYGTKLSEQQLNATANIEGIFTYTPALGVKLNTGDNQLLKVEFTPSYTERYTSTSVSVSINVIPAYINIGDNESTSIRVPNEENEFEIIILSNTSWKVISDKEWLKINPESGNLDGIVSVFTEKNESIERTSSIIISSENISTPIILEVIQSSLTTQLITGIENIKITPNPTSGHIKISGLSFPFNLLIKDIQGKEILSSEIFNDEPISIQNFTNGVYLIRIKHGDKIINYKLIKI